MEGNRERLLDGFYAREHEMDEVENEWDEIAEMIENVAALSVNERIELYKRQLQFMKDYKYYFDFKEEDIAELSEILAKFVESAKKVEMIEIEIHFRKLDYDKSIAELDEYINEHYARSDRIPIVTTHKSKKKHRGN